MLDYEDNGYWRGEYPQDNGQIIVVSMKDAAFQRHLNGRLEAQGHSTLTYSQALDVLDRKEASALLDTRRAVSSDLRADVDYWKRCADDAVSVRILPPLAHRPGGEATP